MTNIVLKMTCGACPEQYDVFYNDVQIGYLRLRHGYFYAAYPDHGGERVYEAHPIGDGVFENDERDYFLRLAIKELMDRHINGPKPRKEVPDIEYTIDKSGW